MSNENQAVQFMYGSQVEYDYSSKRSDGVYFTDDSQRMFVGEKEMTRPVLSGDSDPAYKCPPGSLYVQNIKSSTDESVVESRSIWYNSTGKESDWVKIT